MNYSQTALLNSFTTPNKMLLYVLESEKKGHKVKEEEDSDSKNDRLFFGPSSLSNGRLNNYKTPQAETHSINPSPKHFLVPWTPWLCLQFNHGSS